MTPPPNGKAGRVIKAKMSKPRAVATLRVVNRSVVSVAAVAIQAQAKVVSQSGPLAPRAEALLKLPTVTNCRVTIAMAGEGGALSDLGEVDVCNVKVVHLTD